MIQPELLRLGLGNLQYSALLVRALGSTYPRIGRTHPQRLSKCIDSDWRLVLISTQVSIHAVPVHGRQFSTQKSNRFKLLPGSGVGYRLGLYGAS